MSQGIEQLVGFAVAVQLGSAQRLGGIGGVRGFLVQLKVAGLRER